MSLSSTSSAPSSSSLPLASPYAPIEDKESRASAGLAYASTTAQAAI